MATHAIFDIIRVKHHVRKRNREIKEKHSIKVSPLYTNNRDSQTYGLQFEMSM